MKNKALLFLILALAVFLRFYHLNGQPSALNWDEVSHGYNAYSILKTGKDEWGIRWPLIFRCYGDYKLPVYIYLTALSEMFFGLNEFAVRFPSALAGVLSVLFTYLLTREIFVSFAHLRGVHSATSEASKHRVSSLPLLASFFLAISPWHIFLSRPAFEANLASFLVISGVYFFLVGLEKKWFFPISALFLGLSLHAYNSARIFTPLILALLCLLPYSSVSELMRRRRKELIIASALFFVFFGLMIVSFLSPGGKARLGWVKVLDQGTINRIIAARTSSTLPAPMPRLIHNKVTYLITISARNYLDNLSPVYLFFKGGSHYQYNIPGRGIIYPIQTIFILIGLFWVLREFKSKEAKIILAWWLLALIPTAPTRDNPHVLRTILVLPMPQIFAAIGAWQAWEWWKNKSKSPARWLAPIVYGGILMLLAVDFLSSYFGSYRKDYSWSWQYGYKEMTEYIQSHYDDYDRIFITKKYGEPHEFLLFYLKWDPEKYRNDPNLNRYYKSNWYWVDSFDKFVFINDWEIEEKTSTQNLTPSTYLLFTTPESRPEGWNKLETINFLDGQAAFEIFERS